MGCAWTNLQWGVKHKGKKIPDHNERESSNRSAWGKLFGSGELVCFHSEITF